MKTLKLENCEIYPNEIIWNFETDELNIDMSPKDKRQPINKVLRDIKQKENYEKSKLS